jgi:plasmid maintenance system killer protein
MAEIIINEQWRSISGYLNYQVSNIGRVRNASGHILKSHTSNSGYLHLKLGLDGIRKHHSIHRLVAQEFIPNPMNKPIVDHIDGVKTNNTIGNLRWATTNESEANKSKRINTTSRYKGVYSMKAGNKWRACIKKDGKTKHVGCFINEEEAGLAYNEKAIEYFGEFANLNVVGLTDQ